MKDNPQTFLEKENFKKGPELRKTIEDVNQRLGLKNELNMGKFVCEKFIYSITN